MATVFDFQDEETPKQKQSSSSSTTEVVIDGPFDDVLKPILEQESPLKVVELVIDFLTRKSDLFKDENVEKKISGLVTAAKAKKKDVEEGKKKAEEEEFNDETIVYREKYILSCNQPDTDDGGPYKKNLDEVAVAMIEETHSVQPLTDAAKQDLVERYKDVTKFYDEVLNLPLAEIEAIFSSDDLLVVSEDAVYDFMLKWVRTHFPKVEDRREVLGTRLGRLIRFPFMTCRKLKKVLTCSDFEHDLASRVVLEALFFKDEAPHRQRSIAAEESASINRRFVERAYKYRPVKVVEFEHPRQHCVVFLELKREECAKLYPSGRVYSQAFYLGGQGFFLSGHCNKDQLGGFNCFGLFLGMQEKGSVSFGIEYKFLARSKPSEEYVSKYKGSYIFSGGKAVGYRNLFQIQWETFMADESNYFINDILHLSVELDQL